MKINRIWLCITAVVLFCTVSCAKTDETKEQEEKRLRPVKVIKAELTENKSIKSFSGITRSSVTSRLSFKVSGTLDNVFVDVGDKVKKDQLIAELDQTDYQIKVQEVSASLARAKAQWRNAKASYARVQALYERGNASLNELDATRAAAESGRAAAEAVEKQLELVKRRLSYTRLRSPADCRIASVHAEENENIQSGEPVLVLNCGDSPEVKISVPAAYIDKFKKGAKVTLEVDSFKDKSFNGEITEVGVAPTGLMTTYPVIVSLVEDKADENKRSELRPGMSALVYIKIPNGGESENAVSILPVCAGEDRKGRFVWRAVKTGKGKGKIEKVYVEVGKLSDSELIINKGLKPGDLIVSGGVSQVSEGLEVRLENDI
ncbi:MAG: efflux RND transporter periplasmic adaptor subunit [Thermodesulfobacteriota bacterium]